MKASSAREAFSWGTFEEVFLDELARHLRGKRVLETFAGNGLLARLLRERGVDIHPTSLFTGHDGHEQGMHCEVEKIDARMAAVSYRDSHDVLLMCWPTSDEFAMQSALLWGEGRPIVFIGEVTDLERGHLGGCASDLFFELSTETHRFESYDSARSGLDRAAVRELVPGATDEYRQRYKPFQLSL
jgi:hypothetical protein